MCIFGGKWSRSQKEQICTMVIVPACGKVSGSMREFGHLWLIPASAACPWKFLLMAEPNMQHCPLPALLHANPHAWLAANLVLVLVICLTKHLQYLLCEVWPNDPYLIFISPGALSFCFYILQIISSYSCAIYYLCLFHHVLPFFSQVGPYLFPPSVLFLVWMFLLWMYIHTYIHTYLAFFWLLPAFGSALTQPGREALRSKTIRALDGGSVLISSSQTLSYCTKPW